MPHVECERLGALMERLSDGEFREQFCSNPEEALGRADLSEGLPSEFVDALGKLTAEELEHISEVVQLLNGYDMVMKGPNNCWF